MSKPRLLSGQRGSNSRGGLAAALLIALLLTACGDAGPTAPQVSANAEVTGEAASTTDCGGGTPGTGFPILVRIDRFSGDSGVRAPMGCVAEYIPAPPPPPPSLPPSSPDPLPGGSNPEGNGDSGAGTPIWGGGDGDTGCTQFRTPAPSDTGDLAWNGRASTGCAADPTDPDPAGLCDNMEADDVAVDCQPGRPPVLVRTQRLVGCPAAAVASMPYRGPGGQISVLTIDVRRLGETKLKSFQGSIARFNVGEYEGEAWLPTGSPFPVRTRVLCAAGAMIINREY